MTAALQCTNFLPPMKISVPGIVWISLILLATSVDLVLAQTNSTNVTPGPGDTSVETIVAIRHGEKPPDGLGNLTCRGLNRALAIPNVLLSKYGRPAFIFAPDPTEKVDGGKYYYVRPLATIAPTAIRCQLPVNTAYGYTQIDKLADELKKPAYRNALVFITWEHLFLDQFAQLLVKSYGGDPAQVPYWSNNDYDSIFVFKITHQHDHDSVVFSTDHEGLNNLSDSCP
jgi:hypothetical protein